MNEPLVARHWLAAAAPKAAPALATSTVLILARIWNANGAEHSVGDAVLMTALSLGAAVAGALASVGRAGDGVIAGTAFATSGALALAGVAGYADGLSLPLLLWALSTAVTYGLAARHWRTDRREAAAHDRHIGERREEHAHVERVEALRAGAQIEVAREGAAYATALAQAITARSALPGFNAAELTHAGLPELPTIEITKEH
ncbi:hypothetical protein SLV14_004485 [Streptomyces sp. Je 1-4]|uniref:hypothetical protein n=1 Tax=Streptomyces TaxID=1883 RepID=UPI0021DB3006|nr:MULTISPECIES: hypothetical protein [unclassified Streptomyces]UYB41696.1 hypothetical protein SLV14_004485 [Streptomyces sp. Je 1-4]UZQ37954.1 hypothetical protein SLV14N_004485 [Streptomyces sp. Je 1-4] [Streptomyces sp. Je 1-4 4N24]UZQ45371.1 hypothetical protein SLV14NA_004485 [Streptomyces sp. Je 1-4] [Streptomyces sp. Je 1-4 4N24_ara]